MHRRLGTSNPGKQRGHPWASYYNHLRPIDCLTGRVRRCQHTAIAGDLVDGHTRCAQETGEIVEVRLATGEYDLARNARLDHGASEGPSPHHSGLTGCANGPKRTAQRDLSGWTAGPESGTRRQRHIQPAGTIH